MSDKRVVIIGSGCAGLRAAHTLKTTEGAYTSGRIEAEAVIAELA